MFSPSNNWIIEAIIVVLVLGYTFLRRRGAMRSEDGPLLSSSDMVLTSGLTSLNQGTIAGFKYNILTNDSGKVMILVELGHNTALHLLAFGDKSGLDGLVTGAISRRWLTPVELEGDFPEYFRLYCSPEKQIELRQVFAPDTMAQFADFCRAYNFEIFHESLYISQAAKATDINDSTTMVTDISEFLTQNAAMLQHL
jgi:hypothetical protein